MRKLICLLSGFALYACVKDKPPVPVTPVVSASSSKKVIAVNEGSFGSSNASISLFDPGNGTVIEDHYKQQNGEALGDVAQSISLINGRYYIVVNNSGKIIVCDRNLKKVSEISGLRSPRYIRQVTSDKAYVSDLYDNRISVIDLVTNQKTGDIKCSGWTERMLEHHGKVYVCNLRSQFLYVFSATSNALLDSVEVGEGASSLVLDKNNRIWVLAGGDYQSQAASKLNRINPENLVRELVLEVGPTGASALCTNVFRDTLYFIHSGIYRMSIQESTAPSKPFIAAGSRMYYGLAVNPTGSEIFASDAIDFSQRSNVYVFSAKGDERRIFKAGVNCNGFLFE